MIVRVLGCEGVCAWICVCVGVCVCPNNNNISLLSAADAVAVVAFGGLEALPDPSVANCRLILGIVRIPRQLPVRRNIPPRVGVFFHVGFLQLVKR